MRVLLLGSSGTIGAATNDALIAAGHEVVRVARKGASVRLADVTDAASMAQDGFRGEAFDAVVSCLASRTGTKSSAWAVDYQAHMNALAAGRAAGIKHFVLLSAICVQKPLLEFQRAKLAFEGQLIASGVAYSIVRATAFFKSLSGQVDRVKRGKPFLIFGDGMQTACKPISNADLAAYLAACLTDPAQQGRILPIGGPGPAITPRDQAEALFALLNMPPKYRSVPIGLMDKIIAGLDVAGRIIPPLRDKAELARIGRYYATESMLVLRDGRYNADATPETGKDRLFDHYARLLRGEITADLGDHAVF